MSNPRLRVKASGVGGSGYAVPALVGQPFKEVKNADGELIKARLVDGKPLIVPGVTTALKARNKPALIQWAVDRTVDFCIENWQYLGSVSDEQGKNRARWRHKDALDERASVGTESHVWWENYLSDGFEYPDLTPEGEQIIAQFLDYVSNPRFGGALATEVTVFNYTHGYGGTFDFVLLDDGDVTLGDGKTSAGLWPDHEIQLSALSKGEVMVTEVEDGFWEESEVPKFDALKLFQFRPDYYHPGKKQFIPAFWHVHTVPEEIQELRFQQFLGSLMDVTAERDIKHILRDLERKEPF